MAAVPTSFVGKSLFTTSQGHGVCSEKVILFDKWLKVRNKDNDEEGLTREEPLKYLAWAALSSCYSFVCADKEARQFGVLRRHGHRRPSYSCLSKFVTYRLSQSYRYRLEKQQYQELR